MGEGTCSVADCDLASAKLGMCKLHYDQQLRATAAPCFAEGCERRSRCRGLCDMHYKRSRAAPAPTPHEPWLLPGERWLAIPGYEGAYEVSDLGRVRSLEREMLGKDGVVQARRGGILRPATLKSGYLSLGLYAYNEGTASLVHRLVLLAFVGPAPEGMECCHGNGDRIDNRLINLRWASHLDNMDDKRQHGTHHNSIKTHCVHDHLLQHPNLKLWELRVKGVRKCLTCARTLNAQNLAWRSGRPFDFAAAAAWRYAEIMGESADGKTPAT